MRSTRLDGAAKRVRRRYTEADLRQHIHKVNATLEQSGSNYRFRWQAAYGRHHADVTYAINESTWFSGCLYTVGHGIPRECRDAVSQEAYNLHGKTYTKGNPHGSDSSSPS